MRAALQVWRQLWRTCERSDVLLVLADVRHPLFHFPPSLYTYVTSVLRKPMVLVLNKVCGHSCCCEFIPERLADRFGDACHS